MSHRKRINYSRIETIYLLNSSIDELYKKELITTRVRNHLKYLGVNNFAELRRVIFMSRQEAYNPKLEVFGNQSVKEVNDLFYRAKVKIPELW